MSSARRPALFLLPLLLAIPPTLTTCRSAITTPRPAADFLSDCAARTLGPAVQASLDNRALSLRCSPELLGPHSDSQRLITAAVTRALAAEQQTRTVLGFNAASATKGDPIDLMLYASARDYRRRTAEQGRIAASQAYYDTQRRQMHVPVQSPLSHWRHEWTHAHVADALPGTPYWIHEAMATLIEETDDWSELRLPRRMAAIAPAALSAVRGYTAGSRRRGPNTNPLLSAGGLPETLLARPPTAATAVLGAFYLAELLQTGRLPPPGDQGFWVGLAGVDRSLRVSLYARLRAAEISGTGH